MSRTKRFPVSSRVAAVVAAVALGFGLSGCGQSSASPGAAAIVDGSELSESKVTDAVNDWLKLTGQPVERVNMVLVLSQGMSFEDAANYLGIDASDQVLDQRIDEMLQAENLPLTAAELTDGGKAILRPAALVAVAQEQGLDQQLTETAATIPVTVNPRYGYQFDITGNVLPIPPLGDAIVPAQG